MGRHIGTQNGVDAGLIPALLAEPAQQVRIQAHGNDLLGRWPDDFGMFPKLFVGGVRVGISSNALANFRVADTPQPLPVGVSRSLSFRRSASSSAFRALASARLR